MFSLDLKASEARAKELEKALETAQGEVARLVAALAAESYSHGETGLRAEDAEARLTAMEAASNG